MMSTKYPLALLVMELSETLRARSCEPSLRWIPRDRNQLADDLTNEKFDAVPSNLRRRFLGGDEQWIILEEMVYKSKEFFEELRVEKEEYKKRPKQPKLGKKRKLEVW